MVPDGIGPDEEEQIGAVLDLGQRGRHPAVALQGRDVGGHRGAVHVVHDAARAVGEREHRAHPIDIGAETGEERLGRVAK